MATYREFLDSAGGSLVIEVEDAADGATSSPALGDMLGALQSLTAGLASYVAAISSEQRPEEVSVAFGLKAVASGAFAMAIGDDANLRVSMRWRQVSQVGMEALPPPFET